MSFLILGHTALPADDMMHPQDARVVESVVVSEDLPTKLPGDMDVPFRTTRHTTVDTETQRGSTGLQ